ncbi:hypothetical protein [Clostridium tyrobutyricum]|uniref:hypothetical protein n=1 Tax=Clostridium tyrobutyricum TaxID=1519 RepID=UPI0020122EEB|nr:hypothetical protein [Clostridium tyrobutyricum]
MTKMAMIRINATKMIMINLLHLRKLVAKKYSKSQEKFSLYAKIINIQKSRYMRLSADWCRTLICTHFIIISC